MPHSSKNVTAVAQMQQPLPAEGTFNGVETDKRTDADEEQRQQIKCHLPCMPNVISGAMSGHNCMAVKRALAEVRKSRLVFL